MKILDFPHASQTYEYDCGPTVLQGILTYYGAEVRKEKIFKWARTNTRHGTLTKGMLKVLDRFSVEYESRLMTIGDIKEYIDKDIPVILLLQAWNEKDQLYTDRFDDSHWVTAIGYNEDTILFEDPYAFARVYLKQSELVKRWHGREGRKRILQHGIAVYGKDPAYQSQRVIHMD